jgi:hypothetical protein
MNLELLPDVLAVCRLSAQDALSAWAQPAAPGGLWSLTRTADELSIVCPQAIVPAGVRCEADWRAFKVAGPLDFALVGILAELSGLLARAQVSLFALSTFDTDYILVKADAVSAALQAFKDGGHCVKSAD